MKIRAYVLSQFKKGRSVSAVEVDYFASSDFFLVYFFFNDKIDIVKVSKPFPPLRTFLVETFHALGISKYSFHERKRPTVH